MYAFVRSLHFLLKKQFHEDKNMRYADPAHLERRILKGILSERDRRARESSRGTIITFEELIAPFLLHPSPPKLFLDDTFVRARPHSSDQPSRPRLT